MFLNQQTSTHQLTNNGGGQPRGVNPRHYISYCLSMARFSVLILLFSLLLVACGGSTTSSGSGTATPAVKNKVSVLYAGSLVNLMEKKVGPDFTQATGYPYEGEGKGSTALANEIKGHLRTPDIFISADAECSLIPSCLQRVAISIDKTLDKLPKVAISFFARGCTSFCGIA